MGASKTQVTNYLEMRFDYLSARNILINWRKSVGLRENIENFDDSQLKSLLAYLKENEAGAKRVHDAIERLILSGGNTISSEPEPVFSPEPEPVFEQPVAEQYVEPVAEQYAQEAYAEPVAEQYEQQEAYAEPVAEEAQSEEVQSEEAQSEENQESGDEASADNNGGKRRRRKH